MDYKSFILMPLLVLLKEGCMLPVENDKDPRCKPGQRQRGNATVSICCNPAMCLQIFEKCNETDTDDVCLTCEEGYCSRNAFPYSTLYFEESPLFMCERIEQFCDGVAGTEPIYNAQGCVLDCKCKDGYFGYHRESRECKQAIDPCHRKGVQLSDDGFCMDCPTDKFKNFTVGKCIKKSVCGPDETIVDVGSTKTDVICRKKSDQKPASIFPPAVITDASRSQESTTGIIDRVTNTGSNTEETQTVKTVKTRFPYEWVIVAVVVIILISIAVVAVILKDDPRRQRIYQRLSYWKECRHCPCRNIYDDVPNNEAHSQDGAIPGGQASKQHELPPMNISPHPDDDEQSSNDSGTSGSILCSNSAEFPTPNENRNSSAENVSRDDSGISYELGGNEDLHESTNPDETMISLNIGSHDDIELSSSTILPKKNQRSFPPLSNKETDCIQSIVHNKPEELEQRKVTDAVKDEEDDETDRIEHLSQLPDDVNSEQSIPDAEFRASDDSQAPQGAQPKTPVIGIVKPVLQIASQNVQPQQPVCYGVENTATVFNNGASLHHAETHPQQSPDPVVAFPNVDLASVTDLSHDSSSLQHTNDMIGPLPCQPRQNDCYLSAAPPLFSTETDGLLESQDGHADENSEDETFSKEI